MAAFQAVILAAGMGVRLRPAHQDVPKGFVCAGGTSLIQRSVENLQAFGIPDIIIVTGYRTEFYEEFSRRKKGVRTLRNNRFQDSGSMYSFYLSRNEVEGNLLLLESDLIYEKRALETLLASRQPDAVLLSGFTGAGDEVYVSTCGNRVTGISKDRSGLHNITGEWVGIIKLSPELAEAMFAWGKRRFENGQTLRGDYESDCLAEVAQNRPVGYEKVEDLAWAEVDDRNHLDRLEKLVLPAVVRNDLHYAGQEKTR